jgi:hypothetical protein
MSDKIVINNLFEFEADAKDQKATEWRGMPEFNQPDNGPYRQVTISFKTPEDLKDFAKLTGLSITDKTKSAWFPYRAMNRVSELFYFDEADDVHPGTEAFESTDEEDEE